MPPRKNRILLFEDEHLLRSSLARALRNAGFDVCEAQSYEEARGEIKGCDLVILDLDAAQGARLIPEIQQLSPQAKIIAIKACAASGGDEGMREAGFDRLYDKPFELEEMRKAVYELLSVPAPS